MHTHPHVRTRTFPPLRDRDSANATRPTAGGGHRVLFILVYAARPSVTVVLYPDRPLITITKNRRWPARTRGIERKKLRNKYENSFSDEEKIPSRQQQCHLYRCWNRCWAATAWEGWEVEERANRDSGTLLRRDRRSITARSSDRYSPQRVLFDRSHYIAYVRISLCI